MRIATLFLCLCVLFALVGCTGSNHHDKSAAFYYCLNDIDHINNKSVFEKEKKDFVPTEGNLLSFLNEYLKGPESDRLYNPFPSGASITDAKREGNVLTLNLSQHFDRLPLENLSLAIACLVQTIYSNTSIPVVLLIPYGTFVDGSTYKTFTADSFLYSDENTAYSTPE